MPSSPCDHFSVIEVVCHRKAVFKNNLVSNIIEGLKERKRLGRFHQNQIRDILQEFQCDKMNDICGERKGLGRREGG